MYNGDQPEVHEGDVSEHESVSVEVVDLSKNELAVVDTSDKIVEEVGESEERGEQEASQSAV